MQKQWWECSAHEKKNGLPKSGKNRNHQSSMSLCKDEQLESWDELNFKNTIFTFLYIIFTFMILDYMLMFLSWSLSPVSDKYMEKTTWMYCMYCTLHIIGNRFFHKKASLHEITWLKHFMVFVPRQMKWWLAFP